MIWDSTQSSEVNELITKFEVRKEGVNKAIEFDEFLNVIKLLRSSGRSLGRERFESRSISSMQWHFIATIEDLMKMKFENITSYTQNHFTLMCTMRRSKNITEECNAPE